MLKSSITIKIHRPGFKKFKSPVHTLAKNCTVHTRPFKSLECIVNSTDYSVLTSAKNLQLDIPEFFLQSEDTILKTTAESAEFLLKDTHAAKLQIKLSCKIVNHTKKMQERFFRARPVYKSEENYLYLEKELKARMIRKKITSREYLIHGIFANMPEPLEYKYDFSVKKLLIRVPKTPSHLSSFAIIEMVKEKNKILKIPLSDH